MKRTTIEICEERMAWQRKRSALLRIMQRRGGWLSDAGLENHRRLLHDYEAKITELTDEIGERRGGNDLVVQR